MKSMINCGLHNRATDVLGRFTLAFLFALCSLFLLGQQASAEDGFTEDAAAAVKQAIEQDKDILLLFTGSDWCPPCKRLEAEVFSQQEFLDGAKKDFVLIKFDFPKRAEQDDALKKQNAEWSSRFGVESFPTVIFTDHDLRPIGFAGYEEGGAENYLEVLNDSRQARINRDKKLAAAEKAEGDEKAKLLDEALTEIGEEIVSVYYTELVEEIVAIDNDNRLGLRAKWNAAADAEMRKVVITDLLMMSRLGKPEQAIALIDEVMQEIAFSNTEKLTILQMKLNLAKSLKDADQVDAVLDQMIGLDGVAGTTRDRLIAKKAYLMVGAERGNEAMALLDAELKNSPKAGYLFLAKGQLLAAKNQHEEALAVFADGIDVVVQNADLSIELVAGKADSMFALDKQDEALRTLDDFAEDANMPTDLRAEALLHKAMIMRAMGRDRQAQLTENRAIEITESAKERSGIQKIVEQLRKR
ncbi:MAG: thioredoxin fold domain-containing protein [Planctomycetota bacterium]